MNEYRERLKCNLKMLLLNPQAVSLTHRASSLLLPSFPFFFPLFSFFSIHFSVALSHLLTQSLLSQGIERKQPKRQGGAREPEVQRAAEVQQAEAAAAGGRGG